MTSTVPVLVPEGKTATDLTMGELDAACFQLKAEVAECLTGEIPGKRYAALIELAYRWAKRQDPKADRETFRGYEMDDMQRALRMGGDEDEAGPVEPDPTSAESADESSESP